MKLKVLGTQSPYAVKEHNCPGFLITKDDTKILLDCGSGTHSLLDFPNDLENLYVFLSHLHRDHYNDVFNLQYASFVFHNQGRLEKPVNILLPCSPNNISKDITSEKNAFAKYVFIQKDFIVHKKDLTITFCKTDHAVETYAIKVTNGKKTIVYTSDTSFSSKDALVEFAKNADLLISESSLLTSYGFPEICDHLTAKQAAIIAKEANCKALLLTHLWPEEAPENFKAEAKKVFKNVDFAKEEQIIII